MWLLIGSQGTGDHIRAGAATIATFPNQVQVLTYVNGKRGSPYLVSNGTSTVGIIDSAGTISVATFFNLTQAVDPTYPGDGLTLTGNQIAWNDGTVRRIAAGIHAEQAFGRLPILGDALQDAGCTDTNLLGHCRYEEPPPVVPGEGFREPADVRSHRRIRPHQRQLSHLAPLAARCGALRAAQFGHWNFYGIN